MVEKSLAASNCLVYRSMRPSFSSLSALIWLDIPRFGAPVALRGLTLDQEEAVLADFAVAAWR
jgi:hypothetical protein